LRFICDLGFVLLEFMKIYTRTGDKGETSLFGGKRVSKASERVEAYGTVDELNSVLGHLKSHLEESEKELFRMIEKIQHDLFAIGSYLARTDGKTIDSFHMSEKKIESEIDKMTETLPVLRNFILPGGGKAGSLFHVARSVCRRAERRVIALSHQEVVDPVIIRYLNRMSDFLFTGARFVNQREHQKEIVWKKRK